MSEAQGKYKRLNKAEAKQLIEDKNDLVILDVRTQQEATEGMIDNAILIDIHDSRFPDKINELDKSAPYLVYCRSGNRSDVAGKYMQQLGFEEVYELQTGFISW